MLRPLNRLKGASVSARLLSEVLAPRLPILGVLLSGALLVFSFPRGNQSWLAWVAFVPLLWGAPRLVRRSAAAWGWVAGFVLNLGTLSWVYPTCRWGGVAPWASAVAVVALAGYLALFFAAFTFLAGETFRNPGPLSPFLAAAAWTSLEWIRAHLFTGFPWLPLAASQWLDPGRLGLAELGGAYAVSFWIVLMSGVLAATPGALRLARPAGMRLLLPGALVLLLFSLASAALQRAWRPSSAPPVPMAVAQGNIDQYKKWDAAHEAEIMEAYSALTELAARPGVSLIVWPETAVPGWVPNNVRFTRWLTDTAAASRTHLLAGAVSRQGRDYNAAFLLSPEGRMIGQYLKQHLVPFGEYVPLKPVLGRAVGVLNALGSFDGGPEAAVLEGPARLGVNICFEGLFPHAVREFTRRGAEVIVNITNDGWYRDTAAPEQHFAVYVLRAVENRRWVVRAANTGISGFISPTGEVACRTPLLEEAVLFGDVVPETRRTLYVRWGDYVPLLCSIAVGMFLLPAGALRRLLVRKDMCLK